MKILKAGILYFAIVFGAGFVLVPMRILWLILRFGTKARELLEASVMFAVLILVAKWITRSFAMPPTTSSRPGMVFGMVFIALGLLLLAEFTLMHWRSDMKIAEYLASRDPISETV
jgi:hypothetical protein